MVANKTYIHPHTFVAEQNNQRHHPAIKPSVRKNKEGEDDMGKATEDMLKVMLTKLDKLNEIEAKIEANHKEIKEENKADFEKVSNKLAGVDKNVGQLDTALKSMATTTDVANAKMTIVLWVVGVLILLGYINHLDRSPTIQSQQSNVVAPAQMPPTDTSAPIKR
jgi:hypothetical protein